MSGHSKNLLLFVGAPICLALGGAGFVSGGSLISRALAAIGEAFDRTAQQKRASHSEYRHATEQKRIDLECMTSEKCRQRSSACITAFCKR